MDIENLQKQVSTIYAIVSSLNVSGDAVDAVAAIRSKLRKLDRDIAEAGKEADAKADRTTGELPPVKVVDLPPVSDIYDSKRVLIGPKGPKGEPGEPGEKEVNANGGQDNR